MLEGVHGRRVASGVVDRTNGGKANLGCLAAEQLSESLRTDPLQIEPLLATLVAIDWLGRLDEGDDARYVLLCDPLTTPAQPLLAQVLLDPAPSLQGFWEHAGFASMPLHALITTSPTPA